MRIATVNKQFVRENIMMEEDEMKRIVQWSLTRINMALPKGKENLEFNFGAGFEVDASALSTAQRSAPHHNVTDVNRLLRA
jgi:hypothetical protein